MEREIIRMGDPTSHGGRVLEGSQLDICHGKPIAFVGHKTFCPKCKGNFSIIEGALTTTFYGQGVALAGMKTACGAVLIATQFTDTVEYGSGNESNEAPKPSTGFNSRVAKHTDARAAAPSVPVAAFDIHFHVKNKDSGKSMGNTPYRITVDDGQIIEGVTDENGFTQKVASDKPRIATIEVPYHANSDTDPGFGHGSCDC
jgi:uncharacterized Zn-binding protein involved in type VI secretion